MTRAPARAGRGNGVRVFGWLVGSLLFLFGLASLAGAVAQGYVVEDGTDSPTMFCVQGEGTIDCNGSTPVDDQLGGLAFGIALGFVGVAGVVSGSVLVGAAMVAGARSAADRRPGPGHPGAYPQQAYPQQGPPQQQQGPLQPR